MNRDRFPGLADGWARLDGPGGTQMVDVAIDAMTDWMRSGRTANEGGAFPHAEASVEIVESARAAVAQMLGAEAHGIAFGPSMTSLTMAVSAAIEPPDGLRRPSSTGSPAFREAALCACPPSSAFWATANPASARVRIAALMRTARSRRAPAARTPTSTAARRPSRHPPRSSSGRMGLGLLPMGLSSHVGDGNDPTDAGGGCVDPSTNVPVRPITFSLESLV